MLWMKVFVVFLSSSSPSSFNISELYKPVPVHLYVHNAYGSCKEAKFGDSLLSLMDWGIIYAVAHIRGVSTILVTKVFYFFFFSFLTAFILYISIFYYKMSDYQVQPRPVLSLSKWISLLEGSIEFFYAICEKETWS